MATYVVTGGNGYIGSHMCKLLHSRGHQVIILDDHSSSPSHPVHAYGKFFRCDVSSREVTEILNEYQPDGIFHFAASSIVNEGEVEPFKYYERNFVKSLMLIETAVDAKIQNFVFSSTCAVFGIPDTARISEKTKKAPLNTYGRTKLLIEILLEDLAKKGKLNVAVLRYFNACGNSADGEIGENHDPETHLIPNLCLSAIKGTLIPFKVFGSDYPTPDGTCIRDYVHVEDLIEAHLLSLEYIVKHKGFHDFNLGSQNGHSVEEVLSLFQKVTGIKIDAEYTGRRPGDPPILIGDSKKALECLGWSPSRSLEQSILSTYNFQKRLIK